MSKQSPQYVIATIKPWNIANYKKHFGGKKNFHLITQKSDLTVAALRAINPRYVFFPHWSWIIPKEIWSEFNCVTVHETDLPYGRGGSPIQNLIARGHKKTKISAIKIDEGIDTGDVYLKHPVSLNGSAQEIFERISEIVFSIVIPKIITEEPTPKEQRGEAVTFKRRTPEMSTINGSESLHELYDLIRMMDAESYPKAYIDLNEQRYEFADANLEKGELRAKVTIVKRPK